LISSQNKLSANSASYESEASHQKLEAAQHSQTSKKKFRLSLKLLSGLSIIVFLAIWETITRIGVIPPLFLPSPSRVIITGYNMLIEGNLLNHIFSSSRRVLVGFLISALAAVPIGILLGSSKILKAVFDPVISIIRPLPSMAWIPLSLLWLGIGEEQKYAIVFMGSFAPALLYTIDATRNVDPILIKAARNFGASKLTVMREVILPGSMPSIFSGLKVVLGLAWTTVISAELVAANEGLGFLIMNGKEYFKTDVIILGMAMISVTVIVIDIVLNWVEKRIMPWREN
jgi:taurine transport system permease protein